MIVNADTLIILDFETTGLSPDMGDRAIEIGAVKIENGEITERFQELMYPGRRVSGFIANYTGITNRMLEDAAPCEEVMHRFADFIQGYNLVAHNASFDKRFLDAELALIGREYDGEFSCSLLVARRIFQDAPSHKLGELIKYTNIPSGGGFHRALFDSEMTTKLWLVMLNEIKSRTQLVDIPFNLVQKIAKTPKKSVDGLLLRCAN
ncbi:DNA polymerase III alpha subunit [Moritella sp. JT01]|uniref:3'-5' exonuclease n=1 Tax=Moritella sp. JT01 TaxID=756698 RepID=UPI000794CAF2|nr:3'-5' exonuclease [Moritella sp. JT01]KXO07742.1 DNA polymerase III alpha subunit [Moritella sp. JT01]